MPNWTTNYLTVWGKPKDLHKMIKEVERTESEGNSHYEASKLAFDRIIPMPHELLLNEGWYNWRNDNWNTKWEARIDYDTFDEWECGEVKIEFATAWSAPMPIIKKLIETYPKLEFQFTCWEESYEFWADYKGRNGELLLGYDGHFRGCDDYKQFGLEHHYCNRCECNKLCDEVVEVGDEIQICWECKEQEIEQDKEVQQLDEQLWKEGTNELQSM